MIHPCQFDLSSACLVAEHQADASSRKYTRGEYNGVARKASTVANPLARRRRDQQTMIPRMAAPSAALVVIHDQTALWSCQFM